MSNKQFSGPQAVLRQIFGFSAEDLTANRKGELSSSQKSRIMAKHRANCRFAWVVFAIFFGVGMFGFSVEMLRAHNFGTKFLLMYFGATALIALVVWASILYYRHQMRRVLREGKVDSVRGRVQIIGKRIEKLTHWHFCVGTQSFAIERGDHRIQLQQSGVEGREVIVYFTNPAYGVLSIDLKD